MSTFAERLADSRQAKGISQSELARRIGVKPQSVQALESGEARATKFIVEIANELGVRPAWLKDGRGPREPDITPAEAELLLIDQSLMFQIIEGILQLIQDEGLDPTPTDVAKLVMASYRDELRLRGADPHHDQRVDPERFRGYLRLIG